MKVLNIAAALALLSGLVACGDDGPSESVLEDLLKSHFQEYFDQANSVSDAWGIPDKYYRQLGMPTGRERVAQMRAKAGEIDDVEKLSCEFRPDIYGFLCVVEVTLEGGDFDGSVSKTQMLVRKNDEGDWWLVSVK